eukprot:939956-Rhodomonas_salina.2
MSFSSRCSSLGYAVVHATAPAQRERQCDGGKRGQAPRKQSTETTTQGGQARKKGVRGRTGDDLLEVEHFEVEARDLAPTPTHQPAAVERRMLACDKRGCEPTRLEVSVAAVHRAAFDTPTQQHAQRHGRSSTAPSGVKRQAVGRERSGFETYEEATKSALRP